MKSVSIKRYMYIDALRAFAISGVVLLHVSVWVTPESGVFQGISRAGAFGVQLFFVASALTLFLSMKGRKNETYPVTNFFIRRFFRIAPMFYCAIITYYFYNKISYDTIIPAFVSWWHVLLTALFLHGWHSETINSVVPGCWSIAVEMTFYVSIPILFSKLKGIKESLYFLFVTIILAKLFLVAFTHFMHITGNFTYYWFFSQLPVFVLGIVLYHTIEMNKDVKDKPFGIFLILASGFMLIAFLNFSCWGNLIQQYQVYAFVFCVFALGLHFYPQGIFVNRITVSIGKVSYSLYLTHFLVWDLFKKIFHGDFFIKGDLGTVIAFLMIFSVSLVVSYLTYFLIEKPGIKVGNLLIEYLDSAQSGRLKQLAFWGYRPFIRR